MKLRFALLLLLGACAHTREKPVQATEGAQLFLRDPNGDGRRQWHLRILSQDFKDEPPAVVFDEENPALFPPATPVTLTKKIFVPREPQQGYYLSYNMMLLTDDPPAGRGVLYLFEKRLGEAHPVLWWGLDAAPGFDDATPPENWAKLKTLFKK